MGFVVGVDTAPMGFVLSVTNPVSAIPVAESLQRYPK